MTIMESEEPQLQLYDIVNLQYGSLTCTVRCVAGTVRLGETVDLRPATQPDRPLNEGLTVSDIKYAGDIPMTFVDLGRTAEVKVTGKLDVAAIRAFGDVTAADLRLVVR
jgi:hypothetical protein